MKGKHLGDRMMYDVKEFLIFLGFIVVLFVIAIDWEQVF